MFHHIIFIAVTCEDLDLIKKLSSSPTHEFIGYHNPVVEGTITYFSCPIGLTLTGSNTSVCMGNGEWEPDPRRMECKGIAIKQTPKFVYSLLAYNSKLWSTLQ